MKASTDIIHSKAFNTKFAIDARPKNSIDQSKGFIKWGRKNDHPAQLLFWFNNSAQHGGIVKGKARYIAGLSITSDTAQMWLENANIKEDWHQLIKKIALDETIFGGYCLRISSNVFGQPVQYSHVDFAKCRISECGGYVMYCENRKDTYKFPISSFPLYKKGVVGTSMYYYKAYSPNINKIESAYPEPEYLPASLSIDTSCRLATYYNSLVQKNFNPSAIVTIFNGETDQSKRQKIVDRLKQDQSGEDNAGDALVIFTTKDGKATEVNTMAGHDLADQYIELGKEIQQNILSGHNVNGVLFKIKVEGQLGTRTELIEAHEQFINEYVKVKQEQLEEMLETFYYDKTGLTAEFEFEQVEAIGLELPLDNQNVINALSREELRYIINKKYSLNLPVAQEMQQAGGNSNLRGLSAAENADMLRVVRDYQKGRQGMTESLAISRIMSYGISEEEAKRHLNIQMTSHDKNSIFLTLFNRYAHPISDEDEVIDIQNVKFGEAVKATVAEIKRSILNELKGNPSVSADVLKKKYNLSEEQYNRAFASLQTENFISISEGSVTVTEKGLNKASEPIDSEVYTEYVYGLREDQAGKPLIIAGTRDFCREMVTLTRQKALSYEAISAMENDLGENVWDFRGGFYNKDGEITPWCRHVWKAVTKIRRKK